MIHGMSHTAGNRTQRSPAGVLPAAIVRERSLTRSAYEPVTWATRSRRSGEWVQAARSTRRREAPLPQSAPSAGRARGSRTHSRLWQVTREPAVHERGVDPVRKASTTARTHGADARDTSRGPQRKPANNRGIRLLHARCGGLGGQLFRLRTQDSRQKGCRENNRASRKTEEGQEKSSGIDGQGGRGSPRFCAFLRKRQVHLFERARERVGASRLREHPRDARAHAD